MVQQIVDDVVAIFMSHKDDARSVTMSAYMKNQFPFLGINNPQRKALLAPISKVAKTLEPQDLAMLINQLFQLEPREFQYAAVDLLNDNVLRLAGDWRTIAAYLPMIKQKSWWDSVDALRKPIGLWAKKHKTLRLSEIMNYLLNSDCMWDRRVAITLQLQWKEQTDLIWLEKAIVSNQTDHQFFIQKGIGWALREYSKTDKHWVTSFLSNNAQWLSPLAVKESSKYLHE
jgi:3-methyladenine DNA glycosylase AlkD